MRRAAFLGVAVLACLAGSTAIQVTQADRFVVLNAKGKPAVVLASNKFGAGALVVYDAIGTETFAVRDGKVESRVLERWIRDQIQSALSQQAQPAPTTPSRRASGKRNLTVEQPAIYGADPVFAVKIEHSVLKSAIGRPGRRGWRVVLAVTNLSGNHITRANFKISGVIGERESEWWFGIVNMPPQETDWVVLNLSPPAYGADLDNLSIQIIVIE